MQDKERETTSKGFEHTSPSEIIHLIKKNDTLLSNREKDEIWNSISKHTFNRNRQLVLRAMSIAASVLVLIIGGWALLNYVGGDKNMYADLTAKVSLNELQNTRLYINGQEIELNEQVSIYCNGDKKKLQITNRDGSTFAVSLPNAKENMLLQIAVPRGKKATVYLADNSEITIRENSKLVFPITYNSQSREVYLEGEAFLNVTKNPQKKFNVKTSQLNVSVLGTSFNVSASLDNSQQSVVLVTGRVNVTNLSGESTLMKPNQKYVYDKVLNKQTLTDVDPYNDTFWKEDIILLNNESLSSVFEKLCKHYNTNLTYDRLEMDKIKISGKLDVTLPLKDLLNIIQKIAPTDLSVNNKTIKINTNHKLK